MGLRAKQSGNIVEVLMKDKEIRNLNDLIKFTKDLSRETMDALRHERMRTDCMIHHICDMEGLDFQAVMKDADDFMEKNWPSIRLKWNDLDTSERQINDIFKNKDGLKHPY